MNSFKVISLLTIKFIVLILLKVLRFLVIHLSINHLFLFNKLLSRYRGQGSSVGIATDYGLDSPGSNLDEDEIFRPSRPAMRPTKPPVKWVPGISRG